jgi:molybdopterin-containing oxidoreductase family membrane subunit
VSFDFATTNLPGWHSTIFPPYFVAGAIFSGFAMVYTLLIPTRRFFRLESVITERHLDAMAKVFLTTSVIVAYSYAVEIFLAWRAGDIYERYLMLVSRPSGTYAPEFWIMMTCNVLVPQIFWSARARKSAGVLFVASLLVNVGMWMERFVLIVTSEARDFLPSSWHDFVPTPVDGAILFGSFCFFGFLYVLFVRFLPFIPVHELKHLVHEMDEEGRHERA